MTTNASSQIFLHGELHPDGGMAGIALDRALADLGYGFTLEGEAQATRFFSGHAYTTLALGLGLRFHDFPWSVPTSLALMTGPSWADDPPLISTGSFNGLPIKFRRRPILEYVGAEFAISISQVQNLSAVLRFYHRSGAFGLYADNADEFSMVGIGLRKNF